MKTLILSLFAIGSILSAKAQTPEAECLRKIATVDSLVKAENYSDAFKSWSAIRKSCATTSNALYLNGEALLQYQLEVAAPEAKEAAVRDLIDLYDQQNKYFPANSKANTLKKAMALYSVNKDSESEIFALLDNAFNASPELFTDPVSLYTYFELYFKKYKAGDKNISIANLLEKQDAVEAQLLNLVNTDAKHGKRAGKTVSKGIDHLLVGIATCDNLIPYYNSKFEAKKNDTLWLERASARMFRKECLSDPVFLKITEAANTLRPSKNSAFSLGNAALRAGNNEEAAKYYIQSAALAETDVERASIYYSLASNVFGISDKAKAKEYAQKAIIANPRMGKAYMFLAQMYANNGAECAKNDFEKKAMFWLAANMARKAGEVDQNLKKSGSDKTADAYLAKAPTPAEIKSQKLGGKKIEVQCWINETIDVPKH